MKIKVLTKFLDVTDVFEEGDIRTVSEEKGAYFVAHKWAQDLSNVVAVDSDEVSSEVETTLDIQDSILGSGDSNA